MCCISSWFKCCSNDDSRIAYPIDEASPALKDVMLEFSKSIALAEEAEEMIENVVSNSYDVYLRAIEYELIQRGLLEGSAVSSCPDKFSALSTTELIMLALKVGNLYKERQTEYRANTATVCAKIANFQLLSSSGPFRDAIHELHKRGRLADDAVPIDSKRCESLSDKSLHQFALTEGANFKRALEARAPDAKESNDAAVAAKEISDDIEKVDKTLLSLGLIEQSYRSQRLVKA